MTTFGCFRMGDGESLPVASAKSIFLLIGWGVYPAVLFVVGGAEYGWPKGEICDLCVEKNV